LKKKYLCKEVALVARRLSVEIPRGFDLLVERLTREIRQGGVFMWVKWWVR